MTQTYFDHPLRTESETKTILSLTGGEAETGTSSRNEELERIEEQREQSGSLEPSMGESEHRSDSDSSESKEETKDDSIVSLGLAYCALGSNIHVGYLKDDI